MFKRQIKKQERLQKKKPVKVVTRRDPIVNSMERTKSPFFKEINGNEAVYCLIDKDGTIARVKSSWSEEAAETNTFPFVLFFWSRDAYAQKALEFFPGFEVLEITLSQFVNTLLPYFDESGDFIAINLVGPDFEGPEIAAGEIASLLTK